jgi:hypothetical protein
VAWDKTWLGSFQICAIATDLFVQNRFGRVPRLSYAAIGTYVGSPTLSRLNGYGIELNVVLLGHAETRIFLSVAGDR